MSNIFEIIWKGKPRARPLAVTRRLPSQPADTPVGKVYGGVDVGFIDWSGEKPRAGEEVILMDDGARKVALAGQSIASMRAPTFGQPCNCKCSGVTGTIFWGNPIFTGPYLVIMDADGTLRQTLNPPEMYRIAGIAVDPETPYTLYVLDDRTRLNNFRTDSSPNTQVAGVSTYALHTFTQSGGSYSWSGVVEMADPGLPASPFFISELDWVTESAAGGQLDDPPATYPTNCMTVLDGVLHITMSHLPTRYLTFDGASFTIHTLTVGGSPLQKGLRGMIVRGLAKPGKAALRYVLAWYGQDGFADDGSGNYEVLQINESDEVTKRFANDDVLKSPTALAIVCNRVLILNTNLYGRTEDGGSGSLDGTNIPSGTPP